MTLLRLFAIGLIWLAAAAGERVLAGVIEVRTAAKDDKLEAEVAALWGGELVQRAPRVSYPVPATDASGRPGMRRKPVVPDAATVQVQLDLDPRQRGLLWYSTYAVAFEGAWRVTNPLRIEQAFTVHFDFPSADGLYDNFEFSVGGQAYADALDPRRGIETTLRLKPGESTEVKVRYRSQGLGRWQYRFGDGAARIRNFSLALRTNFAAIDFPAGTISPSHKERSGGGWALTWKYDDLLAAADIGLLMPERLNPGPLAAEIVAYAPLSLLFYLAVVVVLSLLRALPIHPMNYLFVSAAFFAFHLLFAYLVDHVSIHAAFALAALVSLALVLGYLRVVVGGRFAFREAGLAQVVFLVLFAYSFFFRGFTGLAVTVGSVVTLAVLMAATGRVKWDEVFAARPAGRRPAVGA